jgi:hypothetical protein
VQFVASYRLSSMSYWSFLQREGHVEAHKSRLGIMPNQDAPSDGVDDARGVGIGRNAPHYVLSQYVIAHASTPWHYAITQIRIMALRTSTCSTALARPTRRWSRRRTGGRH